MASKQPTKYVSEPPPLLCPVCKCIFSEPIISVQCGHTFCRACIEELVGNGMPCPLDQQNCDSGQLVLNRAIMGQLADLQIYCCYGLRPAGQDTYEKDPDGCPEVIRIGEREEHEGNCQFAWVECPVGHGLCEAVRRMQLEEHVKDCTMGQCPFADLGCEFTGCREDMAVHREKCAFRDESLLVAVTVKQLRSLRSANEELHKSVGHASKAIEKLTLERAAMGAQLEQQALTITSLTSRMDKLETDLESYKAIRLHSSSRRNMDRSDATPRYNRKSTSDVKRWSSESVTSFQLDPHRGPFHWQMPFTVKCIGTFRGHQGTIWSLVANGGHLYSSSSDGSIKMWDIADFRRGCLRTVSAHKDCALCMVVGRGILYSAGTDLYIRSWNLESLEEIGSVQMAPAKADDGVVSAMTCSKDFLFTSFFGCIKIWDAITLKEVHKIESISQSWVRALAYDKRKDLLYSSSSNRIHIWKGYEDFSLVNEIETNYGALFSLAISRKYIITGTHNQNIQVYDKSTLHHLQALSGHIGRVTVLLVVESLQDEYMFSGSSDTSVTVWNLDNMLPILTLQRHEKAVHSLALWQDSVFTGSEDMEIKVFRHFKL